MRSHLTTSLKFWRRSCIARQNCLKHLGNCVGWYTTVEGELNTVVHMWGYADQGDREKRRMAMAADPAWAAYLKLAAAQGALVKMQNRIIRPTGFFEAYRAGKA